MSVELEVESVFDKTSTDLWKGIQNGQITYLKVECFRKIICCCQRIATAPLEWESVLSQLSSRMLAIIASGELSMDTQIVASTAYFMVSNLYQDPMDISEFLSKDVLKVTQQYPKISGIKVAKPENFKLSLCHGLLQLNDKFWSCGSLNLNTIFFSGMVPFLQKLCYEYNALCYLSFRTLATMLQKMNNFLVKHDIISIENFKQILNIVMANWDNPLSGVREQNTAVFEQLLLVNENYWTFLEGQYPNIYHNVEDCKLRPLLEIVLVEQSWMLKSKYFLLSAIVPRYGITQALQFYGSDIIPGLFLSLKFVQLVPAGTNLYRAILSGLTSEQWEHYFLRDILSIFNVQSERIQSEHIFSYWLPHTIKKFPEILEHLFNRVNKETDSINGQYSYVSLLRISRKEGVEVINWENLSDDPGKQLVNALQCYSEPLRSQAFGYVCSSLKTCILPSEKELDLVVQFLEQNISADNAAFRQNILNSMTVLLIRIRNSCLYQMKHPTGGSAQLSENLVAVFDFISRLHKLLLGNLEHGSNYQRKYTSLALYKIVLDYLGKNTSITKNTRKSNTKNNGFLISDYGEKNGKWNFTSTLSRNILFSCLLDPPDDIRKTSSEILISHFEMNINDMETFLSVFKKGISLCSSPMFYEAESGALTIKVITTLIYNLDCKYLEEILPSIRTGSNNTVVSTLLAIAENQTEQLMNDVLYAASQGSPVYGILTALESLLTDSSSIEFMKLTHVEQQNLILLLEIIVKFILDILSSKSPSDSEFAPSFGEMGLAISMIAQSSSVANDIDKLISVSEIADDDDGENFNLTPCEQLILNCMWLNIKVCCSLASGMIVSSCLSIEDTVKCTELLCLVLRKCRHKGAIESAGEALNRVVRYLTANDNPQLRAIPHDLLTQFLETIVSKQAATVSRRSAGLAILVHQLVAADMENGKPLLHYCVTSLTEVIRSGEIPPDVPLADLPQSQALHFLRKLVQDSALRQDMASYILDISLLCFENLSSPIWTIRNAALQLFGGLIPKLIGQQQQMLNRQQQQGKEFTSGYHPAFEELFLHIKPLFELTKKELEFASLDNRLQDHSKLMPMLTLLCNLTVNIQSLFNTEVKQVLQDFNTCFKSLFKSDIYSVRKLSAKATAWLCHPSNLVNLLKERIQDVIDYILFGKSICSENELHGYLLNIKYIVERFNGENVGMKVLFNKETEVQNMLCAFSKVSAFLNKHSFTCQALVSSLYIDDTIDLLQSCKDIAHRLDSTKVSLGLPYWVNLYLMSAIQYCDIKKVSNVIRFCLLESKCYDIQKTIIKLLKSRIESTQLTEGIDSIMEILICFINTGNTNSDILLLVLETALLLCQKTGPNGTQKNIIERSVYNNILFECRLGSKCSSVMLPVLCACIASNTISVDTVTSVTRKIRLGTDPVNNEDVRLNTSKCLQFIFPILFHLKVNEFCDETGYDLWQSTVNLLQDENYDIRLEASKFVSSLIVDNKTVQNPYISLQSVFKLDILQLFMSEKKIIKCLWSKLKYDTDFCHDTKKKNINPFDHGCTSNVYEEENIVIDFVTNSILELVTSDNSGVFTELINDDINEVQIQCVKMLNSMESDKNVLYINFKKNLAQLKICVKVQKNINELDGMYNDLEKYKYYIFKM